MWRWLAFLGRTGRTCVVLKLVERPIDRAVRVLSITEFDASAVPGLPLLALPPPPPVLALVKPLPDDGRWSPLPPTLVEAPAEPQRWTVVAACCLVDIRVGGKCGNRWRC